nr:NUDIX domain-containing protein [Saccharopolyspora sp. HNM0983]
MLLRDGQVLLSMRRGDAYDGMWHLPSGKLDAGEDLPAAAVREAREEIGVQLAPDALTHCHVVHAVAPGVPARIGHFFTARHWTGTPVNREPGKCYRLAWFPLDRLPAGTIEYAAAGITAYRAGDTGLTALGWPG